MRGAVSAKIQERQDIEVADVRFRRLLSEDKWNQLPAAIRARFSKRVAGPRAAVYTGMIESTYFSTLGWLLAQLVRVIGAPLPTERSEGVPAVVSVTEDGIEGGQIWTRVYGKSRGFPQVIHSAKRFAGKTGLEEHVGFGIGMALSVHTEMNAIVFRSANYFIRVGRNMITVPAWLEPGNITVSHVELGNGCFRFTLHLEHRRFGVLIHQEALFADPK